MSKPVMGMERKSWLGWRLESLKLGRIECAFHGHCWEGQTEHDGHMVTVCVECGRPHPDEIWFTKSVKI